MSLDYSQFIKDLCSNEDIWDKKVSEKLSNKKNLTTINEQTISDVKVEIKKKKLSDRDLERIIAISESSKEDNNPSILVSKIALVVSASFSTIAFLLSLAETNKNSSFLDVLLKVTQMAIILMVIIYLFRTLTTDYQIRNNRIKINCIQMSLRELLVDMTNIRNEDNNQQECCNHCKEELRIGFQDIKKQNEELIEITEEIEINQNKKGLIDILFGK